MGVLVKPELSHRIFCPNGRVSETWSCFNEGDFIPHDFKDEPDLITDIYGDSVFTVLGELGFDQFPGKF